MILNNGADITCFTVSRLLKREHRVIERALHAAEIIAAERVQYQECWDKLMAFFKNFIEDCHHAKEENELFPILKSIPGTDDSVESALEEHQKGRLLLKAVEAKLDAALRGQTDAIDELHQATQKYVSCLRRQIRKEDASVLALADQMLGPEEQALMAAALDRADHIKGHADKRDQYARLADELYRLTQSDQMKSANTIQ